jgi:sugar transferase (PEP-CTERM system associated)
VASVKIFKNYLRVPLAAIEALIFFMSVYGAAFIRFQEANVEYKDLVTAYNGGDINVIAIIYSFVMMLSMVALGHYKTHQDISASIFAGTVVRVFISLFLGSMVLVILFYMLPGIYMGRGFQLIALMLSFMGIIFVRLYFLQTIDTQNIKRKILVMGAGKRANTLIEEKGGVQDGMRYQIVGYLALQNEEIAVPEDQVLNIDALAIAKYVFDNDIDEIVLAIEDRRKTYPAEELLKCKLSGVKIIDPVSFLEREQGKVNLEMLHSDWMIYSSGFNRNDIKTFLSRSFDVITSLVILVLMMPVLLVAAFVIAAESGFRHPIFYRQVRVGLDEKEFSLLKFRSMKVDAEKDGKAVWAGENDNRITATGQFIRKTRIDELPQIINILRGDMRLVGPRPERPEFVTELAEKIPHYRKRHTVKPGLAGWAQLNYPYGATEKDAYEKLQYDLYYVKNNNVVMDFFILLQTIEIVIMGKGAR